MTKCALCGEQIEKIFLGKIVGTYLKKKPICSSCQKKLPGMGEELIRSIS